MENHLSESQQYKIKYSKTEYKQMIEVISEAEKSNNLVYFIGAGVSISQGYPNWNEYVDQLIKYWMFHLNDLIDEEVTKEKEVQRQDVLLLDQLLENRMDKKRKVDLVHHMIRKYTKIAEDEDASNRRFREKVLDFEKFYFGKLSACSAVNGILLQLVKLNATYITTNYDSAIENQLRDKKNKVEVFKDISQLSSNLKAHSVIHLHGSPDGNPDYFISSASSYTNLYYPNDENREVLKKFKQIIQDRSESTIIFIGCSMEEEEVLSILRLAHDIEKDQSKEMQYYALLKYDNHINPQIRELHHSHFEDYMKKVKGVTIIWYGDEFSDLPKFCERLVTDVSLKREKSISNLEYDKRVLNGEVSGYIEVINKHIKNKNYYFLDQVFKSYDNLPNTKVLILLKEALKSDLVTQQVATYTADYSFFWEQISQYYGQLDKEEQEEILRLIKDLKQYNLITAKSIYTIIINTFTDIEKKEEYLSFLIEVDYFYDFIEDNELRCLWLVDKITSQKDPCIESDNLNDIQFDFNPSLWKKLIQCLTGLDEIMVYFSFASILENEEIELLFLCLKENKILYQGTLNFPEEFYCLKIIQRLLINIDLEQDLENSVLTNLVENIDLSFKFYGKEMNEFVKKHQELFPKSISPDYFMNGLEFGEGGWVQQYPYLSINMILNQPLETTIKLLLENKKAIHLDDLKEQSVEGQRKELSKLFTEGYVLDHKGQIIALLKELIANNTLCVRYCESIVEFFVFSKDRVKENVDLLIEFIKKFKLNNDFNVEIGKLYRFLFKNDYIEEQQVKDCFFGYELDRLSIENIFRHKQEGPYIDINIYINTGIGRYFEALQVLDDAVLNKEDIQDLALQKFQEIPKKYKSYVIGQFPILWTKVPQFVPTIESYQGYSYKYRIAKNKLEFFKTIVIEVLAMDDFDDRITVFNSMIILFETMSPQEIKICNHEYFDKLSLQMLAGYLENDYKFKYGEDWIIYLFNDERYSKSLIKNLILRLLKTKPEKLERILSLLEGMPIHTWKLKSYSYSSVLRKRFENDKLVYVMKLVMIMLKKEMVNVDYYFIECVDNILEQMDEFQMIPEMNQLLDEIRAYLTAEDYDKLNRKFRYLNKR